MCTTSSAGRPSSTAPRSTGCGRRTSASSATTTASRPPGRSATTSSSPTTRKAEHLYEVHGNHGEDPTEGPASAQYPHPAVSHEPRIQQLHDDLAAAGYHPFHAPCGILLDEANMPYSTCIRCATCDGFPCLVHAKSDAEVLGVRPALEHPNVTLLTNSKVVRLATNDAGTAVTEVVVERDGGEERITGEIVVVACGAANTARLLLQSASDRHPNGLANGSDQVGRNYMFHDSTGGARALARGEPDHLPEDARAQRLLLRQRRLRLPARERPDGRQVDRPHVPRRAAAARRSSRPNGRSSGRHATRSTSGSRPRTCRGPTTASPSTTTASSSSPTTRPTRRRRSGSTRR